MKLSIFSVSCENNSNVSLASLTLHSIGLSLTPGISEAFHYFPTPLMQGRGFGQLFFRDLNTLVVCIL